MQLLYSSRDWPVDANCFAHQLQLTMAHIIKARNATEPLVKPDGFQWFDPRPAVAKRPQDAQNESNKPIVSRDSTPDVFTHTDFFSTSARPGGSKYQYVRKVNNSFKVVIPFDGKHHSFGPFLTEADAAQKVKSFLEQVKRGTAALTRGQKRTEKFDRALQEQIDKLNSTARGENRHHLKIGDTIQCSFCDTTLHKYHAIKFAQRLCHKLTTLVDRKGSHTRAQTLSKTRQGIASSQVQNHNQIAKETNLHFLIQVEFSPKCQFCGKIFKKSDLKTAMGQRCPYTHDVPTTSTKATPRRRLRGKQPAS